MNPMSIAITKQLPIYVSLLLACCATTGCEQKEKVLDVETRGGSLEVERSKDSGDIDINIDGKK